VSVIIHRCSCGHPDIYHQHPQTVGNGGRCCNGECGARQHELGMPEVLPTFVDGVLNEYVHPPGGMFAGCQLCDCPECRALYAEVRNDATPLRAWYIRDAA
jgi:hypothetical protein